MKKFLSLMLALMLAFSLLPSAWADETAMEEKTVPLYLWQLEDKDELALAFFDGINDIPYISLEETARIINLIHQKKGETKGFITTEKEEGVYGLIRDNGATVYMTPETGRIAFSQVNAFSMNANAAADMLDIVILGGTEEDAYLIKHKKNMQRTAEPYMIELSDYDISLREENDTVYLPLQTVSDLFMTPLLTCIAYNGKIAAFPNGNFAGNELGELDDYAQLFYDCERGERSDELAYFSYNELCLGLDFNYGLKSEHHITTFNMFFAETGLIEKLLDTDPFQADNALVSLCNLYFGDSHSAFGSVSPLLDPDTLVITEDSYGIDNMSIQMAYMIAGEGRREYYGKPISVPAYEEVGNTAYITFDSFMMDPGRDYYSADVSEAASYTCADADTILLICYANQQIHRENSPIENVVIDLRCNTGGMVDASIAVISWFLGYTSVYIEDGIDGAQASTLYWFDANLDHVYDQDTDSVSQFDMNRFCLISPASFSCGNLVPAMLKASGNVTLIGQRSSGGTCAVATMSTADGSVFNCSSRFRLSNFVNGSYYNVDEGVEPHYTLPRPEQYYNREKLTEYINDLMWN